MLLCYRCAQTSSKDGTGIDSAYRLLALLQFCVTATAVHKSERRTVRPRPEITSPLCRARRGPPLA